jgi:hypothetical protein
MKFIKIISIIIALLNIFLAFVYLSPDLGVFSVVVSLTLLGMVFFYSFFTPTPDETLVLGSKFDIPRIKKFASFRIRFRQAWTKVAGFIGLLLFLLFVIILIIKKV